MNSPFPWIGGKGKLLWIINELAPYSYDCFVDVFGGSGTVTFNRPIYKDCIQIYNDRDTELVNFMRVLKHHPLALLTELRFLPYHARDEFDVLCKYLRHEEFTQKYLEEELELADAIFTPEDAEIVKNLIREYSGRTDVQRAVNFYKRQRYSFNGTGRSVAPEPVNIRSFLFSAWECSRRLENVFIENMDFEPLILNRDKKGTFFYCDPPYYKAEKYYEGCFTVDDHLRLHRVLTQAKGFTMISYNDCPFIIDLYAPDFYIFSTERPDSLSKKKGKQYGELIMTNYDPRDYASQITLSSQVSQYKIVSIPN